MGSEADVGLPRATSVSVQKATERPSLTPHLLCPPDGPHAGDSGQGGTGGLGTAEPGRLS